MSELPTMEVDFNSLYDLYFGTMASRLLMAAVDMKVFDHLEEPVSFAHVAQTLGGHPENTGLMLDALCACKILEKRGGLYRNGKLANDFLVCSKPAYLGDWLKLADEEAQPFLEKLEGYIRTGPGTRPEEESMNSEAYCQRHTAAHAASSLAGIARRFAGCISRLPEFSNRRSMLDLGGGPGVNAMAVAEANPNLRVTVFDRPEIVRLAQNYIRDYGFEDRVSTLGGDYLTDSLGTGYDLIMVTDSLYYEEREIDPVLKKCRAALLPGGMLVGIHAVLTRERTGPAHLVLGLLPDTMTGRAHMPEKGFLARAMARCGFDGITSEMVNVCGIRMEMNAAQLSVD